ncbi:hypothetical protein FHS07_000578 [Microbacterium proteolyticum]|uniref:Uncharacterized protein n=1 Tax=Microbacterium proteolyticum TaxID=1572644 RepID=A0A7W5GDV7_9MICO|nr:hypothetical protein [Microbacterium proteolyticum]MBB3156894.1 hypothetical protein [Microbacterium proteolyticum]
MRSRSPVDSRSTSSASTRAARTLVGQFPALEMPDAIVRELQEGLAAALAA